MEAIKIVVVICFMVSALWFICECVREIIRIDKQKYF